MNDKSPQPLNYRTQEYPARPTSAGCLPIFLGVILLLPGALVLSAGIRDLYQVRRGWAWFLRSDHAARGFISTLIGKSLPAQLTCDATSWKSPTSCSRRSTL